MSERVSVMAEEGKSDGEKEATGGFIFPPGRSRRRRRRKRHLREDDHRKNKAGKYRREGLRTASICATYIRYILYTEAT